MPLFPSSKSPLFPGTDSHCDYGQASIIVKFLRDLYTSPLRRPPPKLGKWPMHGTHSSRVLQTPSCLAGTRRWGGMAKLVLGPSLSTSTVKKRKKEKDPTLHAKSIGMKGGGGKTAKKDVHKKE